VECPVGEWGPPVFFYSVTGLIEQQAQWPKLKKKISQKSELKRDTTAVKKQKKHCRAVPCLTLPYIHWWEYCNVLERKCTLSPLPFFTFRYFDLPRLATPFLVMSSFLLHHKPTKINTAFLSSNERALSYLIGLFSAL
jgi:hypothetical protein